MSTTRFTAQRKYTTTPTITGIVGDEDSSQREYTTCDMYLSSALVSLGYANPHVSLVTDNTTNKRKVQFVFFDIRPEDLEAWHAIPSRLMVNARDMRDAERWVKAAIHNLMDGGEASVGLY